ncbi:hypothetical protein [Streptomyces sp. NRRL F-525]|uniref:hypothetical protein n=1 Tax=Streptomyces sp. NRRL F-525 TaxID=1463861 RepID=UPI000A97A083|nr:hypothetical protein [Streptomyces sp. NRRL F-525]
MTIESPDTDADAGSRVVSCTLCGRPDGSEPIHGIGARMRRDQVCYSCDWWRTCRRYRTLGDRDDDGRRIVRAGGRHYMTWTPEQGPPPEIGESSAGPGTLYYVLLDDPTATVIESGPYWMMGSIPDSLRDVLPDNARIVREPARGAR